MAHLEEDLGADAIVMDGALMQRLEELINQQTVTAARYNPATQLEIDTEEF